MPGPVMTVNYHGVKIWKLHGKRHRVKGPAMIFPSGERHWYRCGKRHRLDEPAVIRPNGIRKWYKNGQQHRTDGVGWSGHTK